MRDEQIIEELCQVVELQNRIIRRLSARLGLLSILTEEDARLIREADESVRTLIGDTDI